MRHKPPTLDYVTPQPRRRERHPVRRFIEYILDIPHQSIDRFIERGSLRRILEVSMYLMILLTAVLLLLARA